MNCKPGDLAICVKDARNQKLAGRMVEVLYFAPCDDFELPDGTIHDGMYRCKMPDQWVVRFNSPILAPMGARGRSTVYACYPDMYLRPLPGNLEPDEADCDERCPVSITEHQP